LQQLLQDVAATPAATLTKLNSHLRRN